jgi:tight adherence protein C
MIYFTFFCMITFFIYALHLLQENRKSRVSRRISLLSKKDEQQDIEEEKQKGTKLHKRILSKALVISKKSLRKKMPSDKAAKLEKQLLQAGSPFGMTPVEFRLLQLTLLVILPFGAFMYGVLLSLPFNGKLICALFGAGAAVFIPKLYLKQKQKARNKLALRELPDVLDLLTVSLEAGLGFDSALSKVVSKKEGVLVGEFHRCLEEVRLGKTRREALSGVKERLTVHDISVLISSILQAEKLGIGMVQVLRVQSDEIRDQRRQRAEQEAMKAPIKMLFPLVLFIFPSLFIVLLGPAILQFMDAF